MRVSQRSMYQNHVTNMNDTLAAYMESNMQGASQKQVNRPSDDPAGMARILMYRSSISELSQQERNVDTARGWLELTDSTLTTGVSNLITQIRGKAELAASGAMSPENRRQVSFELRELFGQLIQLSNNKFEGKSLFAGQNYDASAFVEGIAADCDNTNFKNSLTAAQNANPPDWIKFDGPLKSTTVIRFDGAVTVPPAADTTYQYTDDGGETWQTGTMAAGSNTVAVKGTTMTLPAGTQIPAYDEAQKTETQIKLRPTALYQGADNNAPPQIINKGFPTNMGTRVTGSFATDVQVRMGDTVNFATPGQDFKYSYSTDGGRTWTERTGNTDEPRLIVPGGFMELTLTPPNTTVNAGSELTIKPQRTSLDFESSSDYLTMVNNVGKDVFGGQYMSMNNSGQPVLKNAFDGDNRNLFETIGRLIAACETNSSSEVGECLADIEASQKQLLTYTARIGGRESALQTTSLLLGVNKDDQKSRMSKIEDINLTDLLTKLTQQQLAYNTVLKSSSMIMQLNLTQYV